MFGSRFTCFSGKQAECKQHRYCVTADVHSCLCLGAGLSTQEQLWLAQKINDHVERLTGNKPPQQEQPRPLRRRVEGPIVGGTGFYGGRAFGTPPSLDSPDFWDDSSDDTD